MQEEADSESSDEDDHTTDAGNISEQMIGRTVVGSNGTSTRLAPRLAQPADTTVGGGEERFCCCAAHQRLLG